MKKVKITHPIPQFIHPIICRDEDRLVRCGPFRAGEIVIFHDELADLIIRKGRAKEIVNHFDRWA